jgi:hypothetical protein
VAKVGQGFDLEKTHYRLRFTRQHRENGESGRMLYQRACREEGFDVIG